MRIGLMVVVAAFILAVGVPAGADRELTGPEVLKVLQTLTERPAETWIEQGTLTARQLEYTADGGLVTESVETASVNGPYFRREKVIALHNASKSSSTDGAQLGLDAATLDLNRRRVTAWDGQRFIRYFPNAGHAMVRETTSPCSAERKGLLTMGLLPWGNGLFAFDALSTRCTMATERTGFNRTVIELRLEFSRSLTAVLVLDPERTYAVCEYAIWREGVQVLKQNYEEYTLAAGQWVPRAITIQRYDTTKQPPLLVSYEDWRITSIDTEPPSVDAMRVAFDAGTLVKYNSIALPEETLWYDHNPRSDIEGLLQEKQAQIQAASRSTVNCAALAARHVAGVHGRMMEDQLLTQLTPEVNGPTSLLDLKKVIEESGLMAVAVQTDAKSLAPLSECSVILHLDDSAHYVVLDELEKTHAWVLDLASRHFYARRRIDELACQWGQGIALLVSDRSLEDKWLDRAISDEQATKIKGSDQSGFGYYECDPVIQPFEVILCPEPYGGVCHGRYWELAEVHGCIESEGPSTCTGTGVPRGLYAPCVNGSSLNSCTTGDEFLLRPVRGCLNW